jgi:hypothetical protein
MVAVTTRDDRIARTNPPAAQPLRVNPVLEQLAHWLDDSFQVPGTPWRIGLDGLIGLIPGVGDAVTLVSAAVVLQEAKRLGLSRWQRFRIMGYYALDGLLGAVPLLGDVFDMAFKANVNILRLLERHA